MRGLQECQVSGVAVNDLGWEIYSEGLIKTAQAMYEILPLPIYVTENGTCDKEDAYRSLYIYDHLKAISESDLPFTHYCHWCFCDNFEWLEGESARFGIVKVDYESQRRTVKNSGRFLSDVISNKGVTDEMIEKYLQNQTYRLG
jgi:beta-glucosidase